MDYININTSEQVMTFVLSIGLGFLFCMLYDILRVFHRLWLKGFFEVLVSDILFWTVLSVVTFCFLIIRCQGSVRAYVILGQALGFLVARITVSKLFVKALTAIFTWISKGFNRFGGIIGKFMLKCEKFFKKMLNKAKKLLQDKAILLYNQLKVCVRCKSNNKSSKSKEM